MVIFNSYVKLPEGKTSKNNIWLVKFMFLLSSETSDSTPAVSFKARDDNTTFNA